MQRIYVYYRVDPACSESAAATIAALFARMSPFCGAPPYRLVRCDDAQTWLEVYEGVSDLASFTLHLDESVRLLRCGAFVDGARHLERFCTPDRPA